MHSYGVQCSVASGTATPARALSHLGKNSSATLIKKYEDTPSSFISVGLMPLLHIYFTLCVIIQYYFVLLLKLPSLWELFHLAPLTYLHYVASCCLLFSGPRRLWRLILCISHPSPRISHSPRSPGARSFYWQIASEPKFELPGVLLVTGVSLLLGLLIDKSREIYGCI